MTTTQIVKCQADNGLCAISSATEVLQHVPLSDAGKTLVSADIHGSVLLSRLIETNREIDALRLMPYLMPIRQAIWWGALCAWRGNSGQPGPLEDAALSAVVAWVRNPGEAEWSAAVQAGQADNGDSAGGCCALAIEWAGFCSPTANWTHHDVRNAASLLVGAALAVVGNSTSAAFHRRLLGLGIEVARGVHPWDGDPPR